MRLSFAFSSLLLCSPLNSVFAQSTDSIKKIPIANTVRSQKIDVKHQAIDIRFDWKKKQIFGTTFITLSTLTVTDKITLDAGMLTIHSISLSGGIVLPFTYDGIDKNENLQIALNRIYQPTEELTIKIDYHTNWVNESDPNNIGGSFGKGIRFFEPTSTTPLKRKQIWSSGEPESNRYWFPCHDLLSDLRTTEFTATVEKPLMVISNGELIQTIENNNGTRTFHYKTTIPYPNYLTSFVVGEYVEIIQKYKDLTLHSFGYPDEKAAIEATIIRLPDMVNFFSETTGMKFPFSSYSQVVVQDYPFPGLIGQHMAATISDNMIDDYRTHADFFYLWDGVESQAIASQWFGNLLTPKEWKDSWLNQSFSHYFDGLYADYKNGHDEFLSYYLSFDQSTMLNDWNSGYRHPIVTENYKDLTLFTSDNYSKIRGSLVLRMLRKELGEKNWWKAIKLYIKSNAFKQVTTTDFKKAVEQSSGKSMEWFFEQWLYKMGHPVFEVTKNYNQVKKQFWLKVKQLQKVDSTDEYPQVEYFKGKIEIEIDGLNKVVWLEPKAENVFTFTLSHQPKLVHFDYENTWIKEIKFEKTLDELLYQLQFDKDILGKYSAIDGIVKIANNEKTSLSDKTTIHSVFRKIILSSSYWRLRNYALSKLVSMLPTKLDKPSINMLLSLIKNDKPWVKVSALFFLGNTEDPRFADIYINALTDTSDRVINAAANALGKTKSPKAFDALIKLADKPSWKSQSLISTLNGLKELGDPRGVDFALKALANVKSPRWWLGVSVWDYPIAAAETLVRLGKADLAYPMILERFKTSVNENDINDIFSNIILLTTLADPRGQEVFDLLKNRFKEDENAMIAVNQYEQQFKKSIKKN